MARVPLVASSAADTNRAVFDAWSLAHVGWGGLAGGLGMNPWIFLVLTGVYEVAEYAHEHPHGSRIFGSKRPESGANMIADVGLAALAYAVARRARRR